MATAVATAAKAPAAVVESLGPIPGAASLTRLVLTAPTPPAAQMDAVRRLCGQLDAAGREFLASDPAAVRLAGLKAEAEVSRAGAVAARGEAAAAGRLFGEAADPGERLRLWDLKCAREREAEMHAARLAELAEQLPRLHRAVGMRLESYRLALAQRLAAEARGELAAAHADLCGLVSDRLPQLLALAAAAMCDASALARATGLPPVE